jgi:hypothetical protein
MSCPGTLAGLASHGIFYALDLLNSKTTLLLTDFLST